MYSPGLTLPCPHNKKNIYTIYLSMYMHVQLCTERYIMKVYEFRKDLKKHFDKAIREPVFIERGGLVFKLERYGYLTSSMVELAVGKIEHTGDSSYTMDVERVDRVLECKNGHRIPEGRNKCLGKKCKYG